MNHEKLIETVCSIGDVLLEHLPSNDKCHELVRTILDAQPTKDYPFHPSSDFLANELELMDNELGYLLQNLDKKVTEIFYKKGNIEFNKLPLLNIPVIASAFVFKIEETQSVAIKTRQQVSLGVGEEIFPYYFRDVLGSWQRSV